MVQPKSRTHEEKYPPTEVTLGPGQACTLARSAKEGEQRLVVQHPKLSRGGSIEFEVCASPLGVHVRVIRGLWLVADMLYSKGSELFLDEAALATSTTVKLKFDPISFELSMKSPPAQPTASGHKRKWVVGEDRGESSGIVYGDDAEAMQSVACDAMSSQELNHLLDSGAFGS